MNQRAGELAAVLAQAETERDFDRIKIEVQEVTTRLEEARTDFARLLLAKHMLEAANCHLGIEAPAGGVSAGEPVAVPHDRRSVDSRESYARGHSGGS